jgi:hypothetical protein
MKVNTKAVNNRRKISTIMILGIPNIKVFEPSVTIELTIVN